jgi:hypothetical protein
MLVHRLRHTARITKLMTKTVKRQFGRGVTQHGHAADECALAVGGKRHAFVLEVAHQLEVGPQREPNTPHAAVLLLRRSNDVTHARQHRVIHAATVAQEGMV